MHALLLTSDVEGHGVADAVALDVVRHAGVDARGVPLDVLQHQRLVRYDHPSLNVVHQRVLLQKNVSTEIVAICLAWFDKDPQ